MDGGDQEVLRSRIYEDFSWLFHFPGPETWELLHSERFVQDLSRYWNRETALASVIDSLDALKSEYQRTFGHTMSPEFPLYETQYGMAHIFMQTQELADIGGFYKAFGLSIGTGTAERLDHLSVELEFMSYLTHKEAYAISQNQAEQADLCRQVQGRFLQDHLGRWVPVFAARFRNKGPEGLYRELAGLLEEFIRDDAKDLNVQPAPLRTVDAQIPLPEPAGGSPCDEAEGCPMSANEIFQEGAEL